MERSGKESRGVLSSSDIIREREAGNIVIEPFNPLQVSNCSYDITLGDILFESIVKFPCQGIDEVLNPWRKGDMQKYWGNPCHAVFVESETESKHVGLPIGARYIALRPRGSILAHSNEWIGGKNFITTVLHARSTIGRSEITICNCAGCGDIGYINRWTLEVRNQSDSIIILPVGVRIGQIVFFYSSKPVKEYSGKYQTSNLTVEEMKASWKPEDMLPKAYLDFDSPNLGTKEIENSSPKATDDLRDHAVVSLINLIRCIVREDLKQDLGDLVESKDVPDKVFKNAAICLSELCNRNYEPDAIVISPTETVNLKYGEITLIIKGTPEFLMFDHRNMTVKELSWKSVLDELLKIKSKDKIKT